MSARPITVRIDVPDTDVAYDETDAVPVGAAAAEAIHLYVNAGGVLDSWRVECEPVEADSFSGLRLTLQGEHRDQRVPAGDDACETCLHLRADHGPGDGSCRAVVLLRGAVHGDCECERFEGKP